jgi:hypothetical protein
VVDSSRCIALLGYYIRYIVSWSNTLLLDLMMTEMGSDELLMIMMIDELINCPSAKTLLYYEDTSFTTPKMIFS